MFVKGRVASGGELAHVREALPDARLALGGPGKTDDELELALNLDVERIHVESPYELSRLARIAETAGREVDILLRVNLAGDRSGVALAMSGPFGMDPELMDSCTDILTASPHVRLRGIHAHLASGLDAAATPTSEIKPVASAFAVKAVRPMQGCTARADPMRLALPAAQYTESAEPSHGLLRPPTGRQKGTAVCSEIAHIR